MTTNSQPKPALCGGAQFGIIKNSNFQQDAWERRQEAEAYGRKQALEEVLAICSGALSFPDSKYYISDKIKELLT